jgi:ATP-binding cassette, subfamily B, bacterial PglK
MATLRIILSTFRLLNLPNKSQIYLLLVSIVLLVIFEVVSLGLFLPVITNILQDDRDFIFFNFLKNYELFFLINIFFIFFIIKSIFNLFLVKKQINIKNNITANFVTNYFETLLKKNLIFFKKNNTSLLIKNIINEAPELINNIIYSSLLLITDFVIIFLIALFILINFTSVSLYIFPFFILFYLIYLKIFKGFLFKIGSERYNALQNCIRYLSDSFGSITEIKLTSSEKTLFSYFRLSSEKLYQMNGKHAYFQTIPKYLMEISIIFIFLITFIVFDFFQLNIKELLTFSSFVLVASLKIMPALSRIISSLQSIQYSSPSLILLKKQIDEKNIEIISKEEIIFERSIKLNNLSFKFENSKNILSQINNEIKKNEITGIVGKNGSGKSTLINIIMGLIKIDNNMLFVDDKNVNLQNSNWYKKISYVSNKSFLLDTNIENNIVFEIKGKNIDRKKLEYAIDFLELDKVFEDFPDGLKTEIGHNASKISSGQKQKICLARAFYHDSEILIFDEATNSMDEEGERNFFNKLLRLKKQKTIIIVSHDSKNLSLCDRIISLN